MKILSLFAVICCLSMSCDNKNTFPKDVEDEVERRVELEINPRVSIGVFDSLGNTTFYNYAKAENEQPDKNSLYEIGSITKTFTAFLSDSLMKDEIDYSVGQFFPEVKNELLDSISLYDLKNHIAGVPRLSEEFSPENWSDPFKGYDDSTLIKDLDNLSLNEKGQWAYSNLGYSILGKAIEKKAKQPFDNLMQSILDEAGMDQTYLNHKIDNNKDLTKPYNVGTETAHWHFTGPSRYAGGLISNTADMLNYLKYQKDNNPLFQNQFPKNLIQTNVPNLGEGKLFYANGWFVLKPENETSILLHNGGTGGFISFVGYNLQTKKGVVVLANGLEIIDDIGLKIIYPEFDLNKPQRSIAYEIANRIDQGQVDNLIETYEEFRAKGLPENVEDIYWLERFHFGQQRYKISNQLSDIMIEVLPEDWEVYDLKGQNLEKLEQYNEAIKAYVKAKSLNPDSKLIKESIKRCQFKLIKSFSKTGS